LNTVPERYTDRRTDGQLTVASPRSALASRGKNKHYSLQWHDIGGALTGIKTARYDDGNTGD